MQVLGARPSRLGPERLTVVASALIVLLTITAGALGVSYAMDARKDHERARASASALATGLIRRLLSESVQSGWRIVLESMLPVLSADVRGLPVTTRAMDRRARDFAASCRCATMTPSAIFVADLHTGAVEESGGPDRTPLSVGARKAILAFADTATPEVRRISALLIDDATGPAMAFVRVATLSEDRRIAGAFVVPLSQLGPKVFAPATRTVLDAVYGDLPQRDSVFSLLITLRDSTPVFRSPWQGDGIGSTLEFWPDDSPLLRATLELNPALLHLVLPSGVPDFPAGIAFVAALLLVSAAAASLFALHRARHLIAARTLFLSGVSHELRTPLTQILLYTELLEDPKADDDRRTRAIEVIGRETRRLIHMIENVLLFARSARRDLPLNLRDQELAPLVRDIIADLGPLVGRAGVRVALALHSDRKVRIDLGAVRQIVVNLLDNAMRYGPAGQRVRLSVRDCGERVELVVEDEGPGIPREVRERLRAAAPGVATPGHGTGAGLGLSLVKVLARAMEASLTIDDGQDGGARVAISFPALGSREQRRDTDTVPAELPGEEFA